MHYLEDKFGLQNEFVSVCGRCDLCCEKWI